MKLGHERPTLFASILLVRSPHPACDPFATMLATRKRFAILRSCYFFFSASKNTSSRQKEERRDAAVDGSGACFAADPPVAFHVEVHGAPSCSPDAARRRRRHAAPARPGVRCHACHAQPLPPVHCPCRCPHHHPHRHPHCHESHCHDCTEAGVAAPIAPWDRLASWSAPALSTLSVGAPLVCWTQAGKEQPPGTDRVRATHCAATPPTRSPLSRPTRGRRQPEGRRRRGRRHQHHLRVAHGPDRLPHRMERAAHHSERQPTLRWGYPADCRVS
jgi:hypothetical protein